MVKKAVAVLLCLLLFSSVTAAAEGTGASQIHVIHQDGTIISGTENAINGPTKSNNLTSFNTTSNTVNISTSTNATIPDTQTQLEDSKSIGSSMVSDGIELFVKSTIDGMYKDFNSNSAVNQQFGSARGALFTVITYVPDPYKDPTVIKWFYNYKDLAIYFVMLLILGGWISRNLARANITSSVFEGRDLSTSKFYGGVTMCFIGLFANLFYSLTLQIIHALSQYAMSNVLDSVAPTPDSLITYIMMGLCDLTVFIFFLIRFYIIYIGAIVCTVIAVLYVPECTRGFSAKCIENILRILLLQPVTIFVTCAGIVAMKNLPAFLQPFGYVGLTIVVFITCWYMLTGNFEFIKKGSKMIITAGGVV